MGATILTYSLTYYEAIAVFTYYEAMHRFIVMGDTEKFETIRY